MVLVRVRVDDSRHRNVGDSPHRLEHRRAPAGELRVDEHRAIVGDDRKGIRAAVAHEIHFGEEILRAENGDQRSDGSDRNPAGRLLCVHDVHRAESSEYGGYELEPHMISAERDTGASAGSTRG